MNMKPEMDDDWTALSPEEFDRRMKAKIRAANDAFVEATLDLSEAQRGRQTFLPVSVANDVFVDEMLPLIVANQRFFAAVVDAWCKKYNVVMVDYDESRRRAEEALAALDQEYLKNAQEDVEYE